MHLTSHVLQKEYWFHSEVSDDVIIFKCKTMDLPQTHL